MNIPPAAFSSDRFQKCARRVCLWTALCLFVALVFITPTTLGAVTETWVQIYDGPAGLEDRAQSVAIDGNGNVVVTGFSKNGSFQTETDYYTAKYAAADGSLVWEKRYNGPANGADSAQAVAVDASGNVVVTGYSGGNLGFNDFYTAKYGATNGALIWEKRYNGPANNEDRASALALDSSGNVIVTGYSWGFGTDNDYYTAKYAATNGALIWEKRYNGPANTVDQPAAVAVDGEGNVVVTGGSFNGVSFDYYTAKYAATNGVLLWEKRYSAGGAAQAMAVDTNGNVVVTGQSSGTGWDYYTAKYAATNGALIWEKRYNGLMNLNDSANALALDSSGNVVVTGASDAAYPAGDYYTAKYAAADGALLWEQHYNGSANSFDEARAVAVDGSDNVVVTGNSIGIESGFDWYTAKYAAADGALLWERGYNGPANGNDVIVGSHSLAVGRDGKVVVTGSSNSDYLTVSYGEILPSISVEKVATGLRLLFPGVANHSYQVQRAPALTGPWSTNATLTALTNGPLEYLDTNAPPGSAFYRTAAAP